MGLQRLVRRLERHAGRGAHRRVFATPDYAATIKYGHPWRSAALSLDYVSVTAAYPTVMPPFAMVIRWPG